MRLPQPFYLVGEHFGIDLPDGRALFTTRRGGCSSGPYASLNLGRWTDDQPEAVEHNRAALQEGLGIGLAYGRQVHGARIHAAVERSDERSVPEAADGQATAVAGVGPMVLTADCLPIAVASERAVAMLHAGWRGLAGGVVAEGVRAVRELGAGGPLVAAIGPGAGPCCYEVGEEVHATFAASYGESVRRGRNLDLKAIARRELERAAVDEIHDVQLCTICSPSLFFSHRRDEGITGRQAGIAWLT